MRATSDLELVGKMEPFLCGHPAALADIFPVSLFSDGRLGAICEMRVSIVIEIDRMVGHSTSQSTLIERQQGS